ncbi:MAG: FIST C-terminal domain-containing protein, partial [Anaerolineales bacterium]|nr:FIST C-terminal domain-containing protein [Anaerolineales bacterium]
YQIAGNQSGSGALAAVFMRGNIRVGIGSAHGWDPVGSQFRVTRSRGFWLRTLDGRPASETYAQLFGYAARDWAFPPLNYLARLYPLGVEQGDDLIIRAPIRVEADGSFRMNAAIRDGVDAYLLVGSRAACDRAAQQATQQALLQLGNAKPAFVLVLVDMAWQMLLKANPGAEITAVQEILDNKVPIAGGYTLGQVVPNGDLAPRFLNQHIMVIAFGEAESK